MSLFAGKTKSTLGASSGRGGKAPKNGKNGIFSFPGKTTPIGNAAMVSFRYHCRIAKKG